MLSNLDQLGIKIPTEKIHWNPVIAKLMEHAIAGGVGKLSSAGGLVVTTGTFTGRAANDKYIVYSDSTADSVNWRDDLKKMSSKTFSLIKKKVINHLNHSENVYVLDRCVGASSTCNLGVRLITPNPTYGIFFRHLFRAKEKDGYLGDYEILHAPDLKIDPKEFGTRSETVIATNIEEKTIIILGTGYCGEIKKSIFSIMNYLLPERNVLPMHAGASIGPSGNVSVFFGLSGTGKTTLSTDRDTRLIGDDEHGLSDRGTFNFEGGCYAKTINLTQGSEPDIFKACNTFGALMENVILDPYTCEPDFSDDSISENTRGSYPLKYVDGTLDSGRGWIPKDMFFLSADAFGILPPVAKLTRNQAMYYFLSGYTAKVGGTELGVKKPSATFSTCFGEPFMYRKAEVYAKLLGDYIKQYNINVWLINTGWTGGSYGEGERFPLMITRQIVRSIQNNMLDNVEFDKQKTFGLRVPVSVPEVPSPVLKPRDTWKDRDAYDETANRLAKMFQENFKKYKDISEEIIASGPRALVETPATSITTDHIPEVYSIHNSNPQGPRASALSSCKKIISTNISNEITDKKKVKVSLKKE